MTNKYGHIQELIDLWEAFEQDNGHPDFNEFGNWLLKNIEKENTGNSDEKKPGRKQNKETIPNSGTMLNPDNISIQGTVPNPDARQQVLMQIARLAGFLEFYTKKFFEGLSLNNLNEYSFLHTINKNSSLNKSDIINLHLVEYTTGMDILNRLSRLELIEVTEDQSDRRSKKIKITAEGKRVLLDSMLRLNKTYELVFHKIKEQHKGTFTQILHEMNAIQNEIYNNYCDKSYIELLDVSDFKEDPG